MVTAANMREIFLPEGLIAFAVRPDERDAAEHCRDEVVSSPPTFDFRAIHTQDRFPDGQGAVIPDHEKNKCQVKSSKVEKKYEYVNN